MKQTSIHITKAKRHTNFPLSTCRLQIPEIRLCLKLCQATSYIYYCNNSALISRCYRSINVLLSLLSCIKLTLSYRKFRTVSTCTTSTALNRIHIGGAPQAVCLSSEPGLACPLSLDSDPSGTPLLPSPGRRRRGIAVLAISTSFAPINLILTFMADKSSRFALLPPISEASPFASFALRIIRPMLGRTPVPYCSEISNIEECEDYEGS